VKDFVREYWKSAAAGAAGSFLLSLLVGLVTRNPFGVVFLRALLIAVLFAGLAAALQYLVRTHLLEQAKGGASARTGGEEARDDRRGERVDIVLGEESPNERYSSGIQESRPFGPGGENPSPPGNGLGEDGVILGAGLGDDEDTASESIGELTEELTEELPQAADNGGAQSVDADEGDVEGSADILGPGPRISDDRDGLPDISNLEIAVEADSDEQRAAKSTRPGGPRPEDALRGAVSGQDPLTIARAIRTVLKRDDKG
jgi:hypothetical protein